MIMDDDDVDVLDDSGPIVMVSAPPAPVPSDLPAVPAKRRAPPPPPRSRQKAQTDPAIPASAVDEAFDRLLTHAPARKSDGVSTASDREAAQTLFQSLVVGHVLPLRNFMIEVRFGDPEVAWIAGVRPTVASVRAMAEQVELPDLTRALDDLGAALSKAGATAGSKLDRGAKEALLVAYKPLATRLPDAFGIEGERDRREPVIVGGLFEQVPGLEPLHIDRLVLAGLSRLDTLLKARADELVAVVGLPLAVAEALAATVQEFRRTTTGPLSMPDPAAARPELERLVAALGERQAALDAAATSWTRAGTDEKPKSRRERDRAFAAIKVAVARLGDVDFLIRLDKLPFARRLDELRQYLDGATLRPVQAARGLTASAATPRRKDHG